MNDDDAITPFVYVVVDSNAVISNPHSIYSFDVTSAAAAAD